MDIKNYEDRYKEKIYLQIPSFAEGDFDTKMNKILIKTFFE